MAADLIDFQWAHSDLSMRWVMTLIHFLWQGALVGVGVVAVERTFRLSANAKHTLYSFALVVLPILVGITFVSVDVPSTKFAAATGEFSMIGMVTDGVSASAVAQQTVDNSPMPIGQSLADVDANNVPEANAGERRRSLTDSANSDQSPLSRVSPFIAGAYAVGALCFLLRLGVALWGGHRLRRQARPVDDAHLLELIRRQSSKLGLRGMPLVAYCERVAVPTVIGIVRPIILLPGTLVTGLDTNQLAAVISHELAHIRRFDLAMNLLQRVIESFLFFHPAVWFISRRLSSERESCCDDLVLSLGTERMEYVGALLRVAELCHRGKLDRGAIAALAASGTSRTQFERRIERLLSPVRQSRLRLTRGGLAVIALLLTSVAVAASALAAGQATDNQNEPVEDSTPSAESDDNEARQPPPTDPQLLLNALKQRDAEFDNRTLEIEQRWTEHISPRASLAQRRFNDHRFGIRDQEYPDPEDVPDDYDQPHRMVQRLTVRGPEVTLQTVKDLEPRIHEEYGILENAGFRWSNLGGTERSYSPETNTLHTLGSSGETGVLCAYQCSYQWACGYGFGDRITSINSVKMESNRIVVKATARVFFFDKAHVELELDSDLIVRKAVVTNMTADGGSNDFVVETRGTVERKGAPPFAKQGRYRRIVRPKGRTEYLQDNYEVIFVDISPPLSDEQYRTATEINPDEQTHYVDMRPRGEKQTSSKNLDDAATDLAAALEAINREVEQLPFDVDAKSLTVEDVVGAIQRLLDVRDQKTVEGANDFPWNNDLSVAEAADLQRIATGQRLPANAQLRHFVRYDTGSGMQHGSWVRLMLQRKDAGPLSIAIRAHSEFERPYTQKERRFRDVVGPHGMVGMNRLVTYFDKDPKFGMSPALTADYNKLVEMANRAIVQKDVEGIMNLFHWEGTATDESLRPFVKREIENLIKQESIRLSFSRKRFTGSLRQWQVFRTFEPNLPVEGFVDIKLDDRDAPQTLQWEVGSSDGKPRFVCHVIAEDDWDKWIGKEMTGKLQFSGFFVALPNGVLEQGTTLRAPDEMAPLREANREIWRRPMPNQQVDRPKVSRNVGDDASNAIHSIATTLQDGANTDVQRLKPLLDRWAKQKKGPFGSPKLHTADDDGNITELRLGRLELQQGDLAVIGTLRLLQELNLNNTNVTDEQMSILAGLVNLVDLNLFDTELSGDAMKHLRPLKNLERLDIGRTKITDDGLVTLKELPKLRYLCLHDTRISDEAGKTLSQLQGLSTLKLGDTRVSGATLRDVKKLKNLSGLAINMTQVTPDELNAFAEDSRFSWMKSHQATLDEYIRRIEAGDFDRVTAMHTVVGLAIPARGSYEMTKMIAQPANQKDLKLNRKRYRIEFKWKTDEFEEGFYALVGIERGTVICHSMGIVKSEDTRESKK